MKKIEYKANFLWKMEGELEELLYDFANCTTEEYRLEIYKAIKQLMERKNET